MFRKGSRTKTQVAASTVLKNDADHERSNTKLIANKLLHHIRNSNWELAMDRLHRKPTDIHDRHLFLHEALQKRAPISVVKALHAARPDAIYHQEPNQKRMALHVACEFSLPVQVIHYLCEKFDRATQHVCKGGRLPLHLACISTDTPVAAVIYLLSAFPLALQVKDKMGFTPLDYAIKSGHGQAEFLIRELERGFSFWSAHDVDGPKAYQFAWLICERSWEAARECLLTSPEESILWSAYKDKRYLPIHLACMFQAPIDIIAELAEIHPYGLELTCQDENRTALHLACHYGSTYRVIKILLDSHAGAASCADDLGLLPLHLAFARCSNVTPTAGNDAGSNDNKAIIQALLNATSNEAFARNLNDGTT